VKVIRTAKDKPLYVHRFGGDHNNITIISSKPLDLERIEGTTFVVESDLLPAFKEWLKDNLVSDAVKELESSKAQIGRARKTLGIRKYTVPGKSQAALRRQSQS
jgi:hypothetical protein